MKTRPVTNWDDVPVVMDLPFAARILELSPESLRKLCQKGKFPGFKAAKGWRVEKEVLQLYIRDRRAPMQSGDTA